MFQKQPMMRKVIYSLVPVYIFALYCYGLRLIFLSLIVFSAGILIEYIMEKKKGKGVSEACLVTSMLFVLSLPPRTPWWVALIGISFAILFSKEVFGGFGRNPFNPAIAGRLFIYISFPNIMTGSWSKPSLFSLHADSVSIATPLAILKKGESIDILNLLTGLHSGSMGETSVILILIACIFLLITKTASYHIILSTTISALLLSSGLYLLKIPQALPPIHALLSGSFVFVAVFMATDPISAPKKTVAKWIYGFIIGISIVIIRTFSSFPEGTSFGVLLGNTFACLLDEIVSNKKV